MLRLCAGGSSARCLEKNCPWRITEACTAGGRFIFLCSWNQYTPAQPGNLLKDIIHTQFENLFIKSIRPSLRPQFGMMLPYVSCPKEQERKSRGRGAVGLHRFYLLLMIQRQTFTCCLREIMPLVCVWMLLRLDKIRVEWVPECRGFKKLLGDRKSLLFCHKLWWIRMNYDYDEENVDVGINFTFVAVGALAVRELTLWPEGHWFETQIC